MKYIVIGLSPEATQTPEILEALDINFEFPATAEEYTMMHDGSTFIAIKEDKRTVQTFYSKNWFILESIN